VVQELHLVAAHLLCEYIEVYLPGALPRQRLAEALS
jgi:hypothetical protein